MMRTYQTRLLLDAELTRQLDAYADLYGRAERTLFAEAARGKDLDQLKEGGDQRPGGGGAGQMESRMEHRSIFQGRRSCH